MSFSEVLEILQYPFVGRALVVGILVALCAALLGIILVLKHYSLIGHGLADVGFASLSLALALGWSPLYVSIPILIIAAFLIMLIAQRKDVGGDAAIGMVSTGALALGIIITALSSGFNMDVYGYMFGSILAISPTDVILSIVLAAIVIVLYVLFYNRLFLITYDEEYAKASGIPVQFYQFLIAVLTALTIVLGMRMMGTLLISSFIIFPAMTARNLAGGFKSVVALSAVIAIFCFIIGMGASLLLDLPTGASIVVVNIITMGIALLVRKIRSHA